MNEVKACILVMMFSIPLGLGLECTSQGFLDATVPHKLLSPSLGCAAYNGTYAFQVSLIALF
jgi:hypothetical protein